MSGRRPKDGGPHGWLSGGRHGGGGGMPLDHLGDEGVAVVWFGLALCHSQWRHPDQTWRLLLIAIVLVPRGATCELSNESSAP
jgi:hypothetical protein